MSYNKYKNHKITTNEGTFASKHEYERWCELKLMARAGLITGLKKQVRFNLIPFQRLSNGKGVPRCDYIADFVYNRDGRQIVEDAKGKRTDVYIIKKKLMLWVNHIEIQEV